MYPSHRKHYQPLFPLCTFSSQIIQALEFQKKEVIKYFKQDASKLDKVEGVKIQVRVVVQELRSNSDMLLSQKLLIYFLSCRDILQLNYHKARKKEKKKKRLKSIQIEIAYKCLKYCMKSLFNLPNRF